MLKVGSVRKERRKCQKLDFFYFLFVKLMRFSVVVVANIMFCKFISHYNLRSQYTYLIKIRVRLMILNFFYVWVHYGAFWVLCSLNGNIEYNGFWCVLWRLISIPWNLRMGGLMFWFRLEMTGVYFFLVSWT